MSYLVLILVVLIGIALGMYLAASTGKVGGSTPSEGTN